MEGVAFLLASTVNKFPLLREFLELLSLPGELCTFRCGETASLAGFFMSSAVFFSLALSSDEVDDEETVETNEFEDALLLVIVKGF